MTGRRLCGAAVLAIAAVLGVEASSSGDGPTPGEFLNGEEVRGLLAILESRAFADPDYCDLRREALKQLHRVIAEGGDRLRDAAIRQVGESRGDDRRRAELVLAQFPKLPDDLVRPLLDAEDVEVAAWAWLVLSLRKEGEEPHGPPANESTFGVGDQPFERDPLLDVEAELAAKFEGLEFADGVGSMPPRWDEVDRLPVELSRMTADLDGDGMEEQCVVGASDGELVFAAVLRRGSETAPWQLEAAEHLDFARHPDVRATDLDGDGRPEFTISVWSGGQPAHYGLHAYSPALRKFLDPGYAYHDDVKVVRTRADRAPVILVREPYLQNYGGTAIHTVGMCAMKYELSRWTGRGFEPAGAVWTYTDEK